MAQQLGITELLVRADAGDAGAQAELYALVEPVLRNITRARKRANPAVREMQTTVLIDDAFLKLVGHRVTTWKHGDREKFFAYASAKMHDLLIDELRRQIAEKRNPGEPPAPLEEARIAVTQGVGVDNLDFQMDLKEKLTQLQAIDEWR